jgi:hypothetical protein
MGYETKLVLIDLPEWKKEAHVNKQKADEPVFEPVDYTDEIATIDLSKMGSGNCFSMLDSSLPKDHTKEPDMVTVKLFYDGNTQYEVDCYDRPLYAVPARHVLRVLQKTQREDPEPYRRMEMAIPLLKEFILGFGENAHCVLYGH